VSYGSELPDDGGSDIINIELQMDDGLGGQMLAVGTTPSMMTH
jgi:hypothetical protein